MKLQKREKALLLVLAFVVLLGVVGGMWIYPQWTALQVSRANLEKLEERKVETQLIIGSTFQNEKEIQRLQAQAKELYRLMEQTKSYDVSLLLSDMLARHGLTPLALTISDYSPAELPDTGGEPADKPEEALPTDKEDAAPEESPSADSEDAAPEETGPPTSPYTYKRTAVLDFAGSRDDAYAFLDEIGGYNPSVLVQGYTVEVQDKEETYEVRLLLYEFTAPGEAGLAAATDRKGGG